MDTKKARLKTSTGYITVTTNVIKKDYSSPIAFSKIKNNLFCTDCDTQVFYSKAGCFKTKPGTKHKCGYEVQKIEKRDVSTKSKPSHEHIKNEIHNLAVELNTPVHSTGTFEKKSSEAKGTEPKSKRKPTTSEPHIHRQKIANSFTPLTDCCIYYGEVEIFWLETEKSFIATTKDMIKIKIHITDIVRSYMSASLFSGVNRGTLIIYGVLSARKDFYEMVLLHSNYFSLQ